MIKRIFSSQLRINVFSGAATTGLNIVVLAIAYPMYLHFLGYETFGVWLVLATVLTFAQLGELGLSQAVIKLVAEEYGRGDIEAIQQYVTTAVAILTAAGVAALILIIAFRTQIISAFRLTAENAKIALWLLPYVACLSIYVFIVRALNAVLSGLGRMDLANWVQSARRISEVTAAVFLLYSGYGIRSLLVGSIFSYILLHILSIIFIRRIVHIRLLRIDNLDAQRGTHLLRFGGAVFGSSLISMLFDPFNKLMLSRYAGVSTIPVYEIAYRGSMQVRALIEAGLRALVPEVSRIGANMTEYARNKIASIYRRALKFVFLLGLPLYAGLIIAAPLLLKLWLADRFVETLPGAFRIMLIGAFLSLLGVPAYYILMGMGMVRHTLTAHIIVSVVNALIVLTTVFIWHNISVATVSWAVLTATAITTLYLIWQNTQKVLKAGIKL